MTLGGGTGVNATSKKVQKLLDLNIREEIFKLKMADQVVFAPSKMVDKVAIRVRIVKIGIAFLTLDVGDAYKMLLRRPCLRSVGAMHD